MFALKLEKGKVLGTMFASIPPWALSNDWPIYLTMNMHLILTKLSMELLR